VIGRFVIVEGCDGTGKTTLAERIVTEYDATYQHVGPPREDMTPFAEHVMYALSTDDAARTVFDRFHLGTFAYGPVFRPEHDADGIGDFRREDWDLFERIIRPHCLLVLCDPGWSTIERWWTTREEGRGFPEYEEDLEKLRTVYRRFRTGYESTALSRHEYDFNQGKTAWGPLAERIEEVLTWAL
jgi:thymidylate kinase